MSDDSSKPETERIKSDKLAVGRRQKMTGFGGPLRVSLTLLLVFFISQVAAAVIAQIGFSLLAPGTGGLITESAWGQFFFVLLVEAVAIGLIIWILKRAGLRLRSIGLGRRPKPKDIGYSALGFAAFFALLFIVISILTALFPEIELDQPQDVGFDNLRSLLDKILAFGALVILAPIGEEVLFRGYLYSGLRSRWSFIPSMLVTSLIFGVAHLQLGSGILVWGAAVNTLILSMILVYLREKSGALYAPILVHSFNNLIAFGVHFGGLA